MVTWPLVVAVICSRSLRSAQSRKRVPSFAPLSLMVIKLLGHIKTGSPIYSFACTSDLPFERPSDPMTGCKP